MASYINTLKVKNNTSNDLHVVVIDMFNSANDSSSGYFTFYNRISPNSTEAFSDSSYHVGLIAWRKA